MERSLAMDKDVINTIAALAVRLNKPAVNWVAGDGVRRWNIGRQARFSLTDAEAMRYLRRVGGSGCSA
jgi:hypothetical protein